MDSIFHDDIAESRRIDDVIGERIFLLFVLHRNVIEATVGGLRR
jgi:hypothetical protein